MCSGRVEETAARRKWEGCRCDPGIGDGLFRDSTGEVLRFKVTRAEAIGFNDYNT